MNGHLIDHLWACVTAGNEIPVLGKSKVTMGSYQIVSRIKEPCTRTERFYWVREAGNLRLQDIDWQYVTTIHMIPLVT